MPCHAPGHTVNGLSAAYAITYRVAPITGRHAGPGATFTVGVCTQCRKTWATQIERDGGEIIGLRRAA